MSGKLPRWTRADQERMDFQVAVAAMTPWPINFPEPWLVLYLSEYDRLVVPVHGRPYECPNPQCTLDYAHADVCMDLPF